MNGSDCKNLLLRLLVNIICKHFFSLSRHFQGFAFVSYVKREDAARAVSNLNGFGYDHLILSVEWAK